MPVILYPYSGDCTVNMKGDRLPVDDKSQLAAKGLLAERKSAIVELRQAEKRRLQLFRMASHDLKTPLNNLRIAEYLLRQTLPESAEAVQTLDMMRLTIDSMGEMIDSFLDVMELQAGQMEIRLKPTELKQAVFNVMSQYEPVAKRKRIRLRAGAAAGRVRADAARLVQALGNLVSNAIKYSPRESEVRVYAESGGGCACLCVKDEGPGVPHEERGRLFTEFGKLSTRPTGGEASSGLGLWIVKHLVQAQGGAVGVEFPADGGSIFWLALPECAAPDEDDSEDGRPVK